VPKIFVANLLRSRFGFCSKARWFIRTQTVPRAKPSGAPSRPEKMAFRGLARPEFVPLFFSLKGEDGEQEMARSDRTEGLVPEPVSQPEQGFEGAESNCGFAEISRAVPPCKPARGGGGSAKSVAKSISTFKILRPDQVWQPRVGARPGNKNALKHGRCTAERKAHRKKVAVIDAFVRDVLRRARRVVFRAEEEIRTRASSNPP